MELKLLKMRSTGGMRMILPVFRKLIRDNPIILSFFRFDCPAIDMARWIGTFFYHPSHSMGENRIG